MYYEYIQDVVYGYSDNVYNSDECPQFCSTFRIASNCDDYTVFSRLQFATGYENDPAVKKLIDSFDWYILPVFNVDGYVYTWKEVNQLRGGHWSRQRCTGPDSWFRKGVSGNILFISIFYF